MVIVQHRHCHCCYTISAAVTGSSQHALYTLLRPSICNVSDQVSVIEIDDVTNEIVDLMETDDETDLEPSENESDVLWTMERIFLKMHLFMDVLITLTFN